MGVVTSLTYNYLRSGIKRAVGLVLLLNQLPLEAPMRITGKLIGVKALTLIVALALVGSLGLPTNAQAVTCLPDTNLAALIALGAGGCTSQDKTFSSFAYAGGVADPAATVTAHLIFQAGTQDIHGWLFQDANGTSNAWLTGFTLSYTITVTP